MQKRSGRRERQNSQTSVNGGGSDESDASSMSSLNVNRPVVTQVCFFFHIKTFHQINLCCFFFTNIIYFSQTIKITMNYLLMNELPAHI